MKNEGPDLAGAAVLGDRYKIGRLLREEPWGAVWLARDALLETEVALKVLPREAPEWSAAQGYYLNEAALALRLRHPEILGVYHLENSAAGLFLVQEPFAGESLLAQFAGRQRYGLPQTLRLLERLAQSLGLAHQRGVVHRSFSPLNILLKGEEVRIANFSFPGQEGGPVTTLELKAYEAPEVIYGDVPSPASNIFSLGVLGFRLVAGSLPYALTFDEPFPYRLEDLPADLEEIPLSLQNLLLRCLAVDPEERFPEVPAFLVQLRQLREFKGEGALAGEAWTAAGSGPPGKTAAAQVGALVRKYWQRGRPQVQRVKEAALAASRAFLASPRRQLWGLGLAGLLLILIWGGLRLHRAAPPALPAAVPAAAWHPNPSPAVGIPPSVEPAGPRAAAEQPSAGRAPAGTPGAVRVNEERYMLVAATLGSRDQARALVQRLGKDHIKARVVSRSSGGRTLYQVQVGPVTGAKAADDLARRLQTQERITPRIMKMTAKTVNDNAARTVAR
ncbi:MAG: protein kinase [Desulfobaccales bacterium]|jgi:serine/threonine-protein kinase